MHTPERVRIHLRKRPAWYKDKEQPLHSLKVVVRGGVWTGGVCWLLLRWQCQWCQLSRKVETVSCPLPSSEANLFKNSLSTGRSTPNWSQVVRAFLDRTFPRDWIGHGSNFMSWPVRCPDLRPCDFFLWGMIKD